MSEEQSFDQEEQSPVYENYEKAEKQEKEEEKHYEKSEEEKSWDEKWRRDPVATAGWAFIFLWAGFVLLLESLGALPTYELLDGWDLVWIGAGVIVLGQVLVRILFPSYRRPIMGTLIVALVLIAIGLQDLLPEGSFWPALLIILGLGILLRPLLRRR